MTITTSRKQHPLLLVILAFLLVALLLIGLYLLTRPSNRLAWLADQAFVGVCEAADSLNVVNASRVSGAQGQISPDTALERAAEIVAEHYPDHDASVLAFSQPLLVQAEIPNGSRALSYMIFARLKDASPELESADVPADQRLGTVAIMYLDAPTGNLLNLITALNVVHPDLSCFRG